jgi:sec-independent protein translocase protein TatC
VPARSRAAAGVTSAGRSIARVLRLGRQYRSVEDSRMTLTEHLQELRARLAKSLLAVALMTIVVGVWFYNPVYHTLLHPYCHIPADRRLLGQSCALTFTGVTDAFTIRLKVALIGGVILSMPIWLYQLWAFITPGLHRNERRWSLSFVFASLFLFATGVFIAYLILPKALDVLLSFGGPDLKALLTVDQYLGFVAHLLTIFGISFEFPLVLVMLNLAGILSAQRLRQWRRVSIFLLTVFAGAATPSTDPFTMLAMAVPLWLLYEAAVLFARIHDRRKERRSLSTAYAQYADDETSPITFDDLDQPSGVSVGGPTEVRGHYGSHGGADSDIT